MKSVLIVDDNPTVRLALRTFFWRTLDLVVIGEAEDGAQAIHKAEELRPDFIIMDFAMPNVSGTGAAASIRKLLPKTRIVLFTLYSDLVGKNMAKFLGVDVIVDKTLGVTKLTEALKTMLA